jgi:hypothetical protein
MWEIQKLTPDDIECRACYLNYKVCKKDCYDSVYVYTISQAELVCNLLNHNEQLGEEIRTCQAFGYPEIFPKK